HPARHLSGYAGILQADAYAGFGELYEAKRRPARPRSRRMDAHRTRPALAPRRDRQDHGLHVEALAGLHSFPRRWRICLSNNAAERALRGIALGRRSWLFAGSDRGGERAAAMYTLIVTAKLNGIDPQAWLADVLRRIADYPVSRLDQLLPWHWKGGADQAAAA